MGGEPPDVVNGALGDDETHPNTLGVGTANYADATMTANKSVAHRLGRVLETLTRQSGRLSDMPGVRLVAAGPSLRKPTRRRVRIS